MRVVVIALALGCVWGCTFDYQGALGSSDTSGGVSTSSATSSSSATTSVGGGGAAGGAGGAGGTPTGVGAGPGTSSGGSSSGGAGGTAPVRCISLCPGSPVVKLWANDVQSKPVDDKSAGWSPVRAESLAEALASEEDDDRGLGFSNDAVAQTTLGDGHPHSSEIIASQFDVSCIPPTAVIEQIDIVTYRRTVPADKAEDAAVSITAGGAVTSLNGKTWPASLSDSQGWLDVVAPVNPLPDVVVKMRARRIGDTTPALTLDDVHLKLTLAVCP